MDLDIYAIGKIPLIYEVIDRDIAKDRSAMPLAAIQAAFQHKQDAIRYVQQRYSDSASEQS